MGGGGKEKEEEPVLDADEFERRNGFFPDTRKPMIELDGGDEKEYWLFQWPVDQPPNLTKQEVTLALHEKRQLASFDGPSGKKYDIVKLSSKAPAASVYLSSPSGSKIVGGIVSCAAFVHFPEAEEIEKRFTRKKQSQLSSVSAMKSSSGHKASNRKRQADLKKTGALVTASTPLQNSSKRSGMSGMATTSQRHWEPMKSRGSGLTSTHSEGSRRLSPGVVTPASSSERVSEDRSTKESGRGQSAKPASSPKKASDDRPTKDSGRGLTNPLGSSESSRQKKKSKTKI